MVPFLEQFTIVNAHGLGGYVLCQLASMGIKPAAFIFASGIFSDIEVILTQKYIPLAHMVNGTEDQAGFKELDSESLLIASNFDVLLRAIRKGKKKININNGNASLQLQLNPLLFSGREMPRDMFRHIISPTLLIHGSADYDVSLWNVASIEQSIRMNKISPERVILIDRDHWFREVPKSPGDQFMERMNGDCFRRKIDPRGFQESISFIKRILSPKISGQIQESQAAG